MNSEIGGRTEQSRSISEDGVTENQADSCDVVRGEDWVGCLDDRNTDARDNEVQPCSTFHCCSLSSTEAGRVLQTMLTVLSY